MNTIDAIVRVLERNEVWLNDGYERYSEVTPVTLQDISGQILQAIQPVTVYIVEYHNGGAPDDTVHFVHSTATDERTAITDATIALVNERTAPGHDGYRDSCYFTVTGWNGKQKVSELRIE